MFSRDQLDEMYFQIFGTSMPDDIYAYFEHGYQKIFKFFLEEELDPLGMGHRQGLDIAMREMYLDRQLGLAINDALHRAHALAGQSGEITSDTIKEVCPHLPYPWNQFFC